MMMMMIRVSREELQVIQHPREELVTHDLSIYKADNKVSNTTCFNLEMQNFDGLFHQTSLHQAPA